MFYDKLAQVQAKKNEFLAQIERIVPWKEWLALIQPCCYNGERGNKLYLWRACCGCICCKTCMTSAMRQRQRRQSTAGLFRISAV